MQTERESCPVPLFISLLPLTSFSCTFCAPVSFSFLPFPSLTSFTFHLVFVLMQVLSDGAITFDQPIALYQPMTFPLEGGLAERQLVAPFLADHDPRQIGLVRYKVYSSPTQNMRIASEFIRNKELSPSFVGTWMLVAEWYRVPLYPAVVPSDTMNIVSKRVDEGRVDGRE